MPTRVRLSAVLVAFCLLIAGCDLAGTPATNPAEGRIHLSAVPGVAIDRPTFPAVAPSVAGLVPGLAGAGLTAYAAQQLSWADCDETTQCADVLAPLDYANPSERAVTISMRRKAATKSPRLGTLFINPGGPGASGKELVGRFDTAGLEQYDVVGWDPRGTGHSTPVKCFDDARANAYNSLDSSPDTEPERAALIEAAYDLGEACWQNSGVLLEHISTIETVRDLDLLRQLVGDRELNFFGYSYGTQIGATYAELFPGSSGRLVLDAAVNITDNDDVIQAMGFDLALGNFATWCAQQSCALGGSKQKVLDAITGLFDRLDARPISGGGRNLTQSLATTGVAAVLYGGKAAWPKLDKVVVAAIRGNGLGLLAAADSLNARDRRGHYGTMFYAFPAISCLDSDADNGVLDADRLWKEDTDKAPIFGRYFGPQYTCALWPVRPSRQLEIKGADAKPLLVVGGTGDNATPYQQAVSMAMQLTSGVLVTYSGEGHGSYGGKSSCVDGIVVAYLVNGAVPADGVRCT
ncbi:MAG: alpha/beta hydrolase [Propionicimonas sp.]